ncbi:hypothetical protein [Pseudanabaena sp. FACHB-2040]|uniref:hypothetical protein n=1 Tax=Pseudanabaena sp. FACHB-2040 TaxID=2692859 RepID=UPI001688663D|nr:hypothetical protein [Pseudanabaena sp. FACHB-2040]MBD2256281.1 hypothetical protein [Pseudanabaena sp. FACHB-2040]
MSNYKGRKASKIQRTRTTRLTEEEFKLLEFIAEALNLTSASDALSYVLRVGAQAIKGEVQDAITAKREMQALMSGEVYTPTPKATTPAPVADPEPEAPPKAKTKKAAPKPPPPDEEIDGTALFDSLGL